MLSEGSSAKGSPEDKQPSGPLYQGKCQDFTAGHSGTLHRCNVLIRPQYPVHIRATHKWNTRLCALPGLNSTSSERVTNGDEMPGYEY